MEKAYWTAQELAAYLSVSDDLIYKWVKDRKIPYVKPNGIIRFDIERTKRFLESKEVRTATVR